MKEQITKSVYQIVGNGICVEASDGKKVYDILFQFIKENHPVVLSFLNVTMVTSAFLNTAIGLLYKDFSEETVKSNLTVKDLEKADLVLLKRVIETAKNYYKNPERLEESIKEILGE